MSNNSLLIKNVDVWNSTGVKTNQFVLVVDGVVKEISRAIPSVSVPRTIDGKGLQLIPAGVDPQVHLRTPGQPHKETAETGMQAAKAGGYGAVLTMPNTIPVVDTVASYRLCRSELEAAERSTGVKALISAAMTMGQNGKTLVDFDSLAAEGVAAFTDDGVGVEENNVMADVLRAGEKHQLPLLQHAEVPGHGGVLAPGRTQTAFGVPPYDPKQEYEMVDRDLQLLRKFPKARYHVLHISSEKTIDLVEQARTEGMQVTCEVSPHHLFFCSDDIVAYETAFKMNPPIRSQRDREVLQSRLQSGEIDFVATDHAPHEWESKAKPFQQASFGTTGLETSLRVLMDLYIKGVLSEERLVDVFSTAPAKFLRIDNEFGTIAVGKEFKAVLVDARASASPVTLKDLKSKSKNNCFLGFSLGGQIKETFLFSRN